MGIIPSDCNADWDKMLKESSKGKLINPDSTIIPVNPPERQSDVRINNILKVELWLHKLSTPIICTEVKSTYEKGSFYVIQSKDNKYSKYPIQDIFRVVEYNE